MALSSSRNLFILTTLLVTSFLSQSPRFYVEARSIQAKDSESATESYDEQTTQLPTSSTNDRTLQTTENVLKATESTITTTTSELLKETTTISMDLIPTASTESFRYLKHNQIVNDVSIPRTNYC